MTTHFDLVIIGGGAGGFGAAIQANELGAKTLMINSGLPLGGTCVNVGCVPSKNLIHAAELVHHLEKHNFCGIEAKLKSLDFKKLINGELSLVEKLREEKYKKVLANLKEVTFVEGKAEFISTNQIRVGNEIYRGKKFIIATGSSTKVPPIEGIRQAGYLTHIEALQIREQPQSMIVIGGGPIGLEFSQLFSRLGTKVTILEYMPSIFTPGESKLIQKLHEILVQEGIGIHTNVRIKRAHNLNGKKSVTYNIEGVVHTTSADDILLATGKVANTEGLNLEKAHVETGKNRSITVNKYFQTSNPNIFAVGDVADLTLRLETTAGREGTLAVRNALENSRNCIDYDTVPFTIFTDPQYSSVGWTEKRQMEKTGICACRTVSLENVAKAQITGETKGLIKIGIDPVTRQIVGVHILSPNSSEVISQAMVLIKNKNTIDFVVDTLPVFPSFSEAIKMAALSFSKDITKLSCCI